jgi:putative transposase
VRFRFIEEHSASFSTNRLCDVLDVSPRGLWAFRSQPASRRQRSDLATLAHIKEQSRLSLVSYGRQRMTEVLKEIGLDIGRRRVARPPLGRLLCNCLPGNGFARMVMVYVWLEHANIR